MGHTYSSNIKNFWPDDTERTKYVFGSVSIAEIVELAAQYWPGCDLNCIAIDSEYVHTNCLGYDQYDPSDWTLFTTITNHTIPIVKIVTYRD